MKITSFELKQSFTIGNRSQSEYEGIRLISHSYTLNENMLSRIVSKSSLGACQWYFIVYMMSPF
jgi:hypothetical protein